MDVDMEAVMPARRRGRLYSRFAGNGTGEAPSVFRDIFQQPMYGRAVSQRLYNSTKGKRNFDVCVYGECCVN